MSADTERLVTITAADVEFLRLALKHYTLFSEASDRQGEDRSAGIFRKQEFYAERFLLRVTEVSQDGTAGVDTEGRT